MNLEQSTKIIKSKGWTVIAVCARWRMNQQTYREYINDPSHIKHAAMLDMLNGLPDRKK